MISKTFCVYPWVHLTANTSGFPSYCCVAKKGGKLKDNDKNLDLAKDDLDLAWNSSDMIDIRNNMVQGNKISGCDICYKQEDIGKLSYRERHNKEWIEKLGIEEIQQRVNDTIENDGFSYDTPVYIDLRLGNTCNLKCRMCNPHNSSAIASEWLQIDKENDNSYTTWQKQFNQTNTKNYQWYESEIFWQSLERISSNVQKIYMTGGEPTLIKQNTRYLKQLINQNKSQNIELFFNINGTNLPDEFLELLSFFKYTNINISIDGYDKLNYYIRFPSDFTQIEKNVKKLRDLQLPNLGIGFSPVIQIYNILDIFPLIQWIDNLKIPDVLVDFLICDNPSYLCIDHLPKEISDLAIIELQKIKFLNVYNANYTRSEYLRNSVESLITKLEQCKEDKIQLKLFKEYTKILDKQRNVNFEDYCLKLHEFLKNY